MDYTLAKKLKEAGWEDYSLKPLFTDEGELLCVPTLSELIEACGKKFGWLERDEENERDTGLWVVGGWPHGHQERFKGSTPEEAVASLWLDLQVK